MKAAYAPRLGTSAILAWFLWLTHRAIGYGFNPDDAMLINFAIARPLRWNLESLPLFWNGYIRPMGTLFYLILYRTFGYWARPYRVAAFVLIALNLALVYRFARSITGNVTAALFVMLLASFHREMWDIFANTGTVYDLLCQTFVLLAMTAWVNGGGVRVAALLTVCAVESKEMGVALPVLFLAYDALFRRKTIRYGAIACSVLVVIAFLLGRFAQPTVVTGNPAFTPVISAAHYLATTRFYLDLLLWTPGLSQTAAVALILICFGAAAVLKSRLMTFGVIYCLSTLLPLSFAPARAGYALYVPQIGAYLFLAGLALAVRDRLRLKLWVRRVAVCACVATVIVAQFIGNRRLECSGARPGFLPQLEALSSGMRENYPSLPRGSVVTLIDDPFPDVYIPQFTLQAFYDDPSLKVVQAKSGAPAQGAQAALLFIGLRTWRMGARDSTGYVIDGSPPEYSDMASPFAALNIVKDVDTEATPDGARWARADPEFVFTRPNRPSQFVLIYDAPGAVMEHTGPLHLRFEVDGEAPESVLIPSPGTLQFTKPVSSAGPHLVHVKIHVDNPFRAPDGAPLSLLVKSAGLK